MKFPSTLLPQTNDPKEIQKGHLDLLSKLNQIAGAADTAARMAKSNPILPVGVIGYETDTISFKVGDGRTAYNSLTYAYRGLPVAGEPSLGTLHEIGYGNRSSTPLVSTATNTAGVWSAAVTASQAPAGAKVAWCMATITLAAQSPALAVEAATGVTLSDVSSGSNIFLYQFCSPDSAGGQSWRLMPIPLDGSKQFKWCTTKSSCTVTILAPVFYTI